jgi:O-antigen/teichoic acid export membrane protein
MDQQSPLGKDDRAKLNRGAAAMAAGFLIRFGAKGLFLATAALLYGPIVFGGYAVALATVEFCVAAAGLSVKKLLFKTLDDPAAEATHAERIADAALMVVATGGPLGLGIGLALWATGQAGGAVGSVLMLMLPMIMGQCLLDVTLTAIRWTGVVRYEVITRSIVEPYVGLVASLLAYAAGLHHTGLAVGYAAGTIAALCQAAYGLRRGVDLSPMRHYRLSIRPVVEGVRANAANTLGDLAANLYQRVDLYIVALALGAHASGVYAMAKQFCVPIRNIRQSYDALVLPLMSRDLTAAAQREVGGRIGEIVGLILNIQLPYLLAIGGIGAVILGFFPHSFQGAFVPMVILAIGETLHASHGIGEYILAYKAPVRGLVNTLVSMLAGGLAAWLLVGRYGISGAAVGMLISYSARALLRSATIRQLGFAVPYAAVFARYAMPTGLAAAMLIASRLLFPKADIAANLLVTLLALALFASGRALMQWMVDRRARCYPRPQE